MQLLLLNANIKGVDWMNLIDANDAGFLAAAKVGAFKGAIKSLNNNHYHSLKSYWSSSDLKYMHANSPAHFKAKYFDKIIEQSEPTEAMVLGSLVHCLLLTPKEFEHDFFIMPDFNFRTNEGKAAKQALLAQHQGKAAITNELLAKADTMCASAMKNPQAVKLLEDGHKEASFFWNCPFSNLPMRAKVDCASSSKFIELKTTTSAEMEIFARKIHTLNYDLSLFHYQEGIRQVMGASPEPYFIVIESEAPYVTQCYKASDAMLVTGHDKWLSAVGKIEKGISKQYWPGYFSSDEGSDIVEINPPAWAINKIMRENGDGI